MPFLTLGLNGAWEPKKRIRLEQVVDSKPSKSTQFRFDEQFMYLTTPDWEAELFRQPEPDSEDPEDPSDLGAAGYYFDDRSHPEVTGPARFRTDLASIPRVFWGVFPSYGSCTMPALMHDTLCTQADAVRGEEFWRELAARPDPTPTPPHKFRVELARHLRRRADQVFRISLGDCGVGLVRRWVMWAAVRLGGGTRALWLAVVLAFLSPLLGLLEPARSWLWLVSLLTTGGLVAAIGVMSVEDAWYSPPGWKRWWWGAAGSMFGAVVVAAFAVPFLLPVFVITGSTRLILWLADLVGEFVAAAFRGFAPRRRFTIFPILEGEMRPPSGGDVYPLADQGLVAIVDRNDTMTRIGAERARVDVGTDWVLGILVHNKAPAALMTSYRRWIESAETSRLRAGSVAGARTPTAPFMADIRRRL